MSIVSNIYRYIPQKNGNWNPGNSLKKACYLNWTYFKILCHTFYKSLPNFYFIRKETLSISNLFHSKVKLASLFTFKRHDFNLFLSMFVLVVSQVKNNGCHQWNKGRLRANNPFILKSSTLAFIPHHMY